MDDTTSLEREPVTLKSTSDNEAPRTELCGITLLYFRGSDHFYKVPRFSWKILRQRFRKDLKIKIDNLVFSLSSDRQENPGKITYVI